MLALVLFMLVVIALAVAVVGLVAVPARSQGRRVLTSTGEQRMARAVARAGELQSVAARATSGSAKAAERTRSV